MVEVDAGIARDSVGCFRHPVCLHRTRPGLSPSDIASFRN
ncbi:ATP-dependent DNA ligase [Streptomyces avermitilis]